MKGKIFLGIGLALTLGASTLLLTSCGSGIEAKDVATKMQTVVEKVTSSKRFRTRTVSYEGETYSFLAPVYKEPLNSVLDNEILSGTSTFNELGLYYDYTFGYCFNVIEKCNDVFKNVKAPTLDAEKQNSLNDLSKTLDEFSLKFEAQEKSLDNLNEYLEAIALKDAFFTSELARNALYNYSSDYQAFVRSSINFATDAIEAVNVVYSNLSYAETKDVILNTAKEAVLTKRQISKGTQVKVAKIDKTSVEINYEEDLNVYKAVVSNAKLDIASDNKTAKTKEEINFDFVGKKFKSGSKLLVENVGGGVLVVAGIDRNNCKWTYSFAYASGVLPKQLSGSEEVVAGNEVVLKEDLTLSFAERSFTSGIEVKVESVSGNNLRVSYVDENNFVWKATTTEEKVEKNSNVATKVGDLVSLKESTAFSFGGKYLPANTKLEIIVKTGNYDCRFLDGKFICSVTVSESEVLSYERSVLSHLNMLAIDDYFTLLVEEKSFVELQDNYYLDFFKKAIKIETKKLNTKKLTNKQLNEFMERFKVFEEERSFQRKRLNDVDTYDYLYGEGELSSNQTMLVSSVWSYYNLYLPTWVNYFQNTFGA